MKEGELRCRRDDTSENPADVPPTLATRHLVPRLTVLKRTIDREDGVASGKLECPRRDARLV
jgi:hypothetical protein